MKQNKNIKDQADECINLTFTPMYRILSGRTYVLISKAVEEFRGKINKVSLLVSLKLLEPNGKGYQDTSLEFYEFKKGLNSKLVGDILKMLGDDLVSLKDHEGRPYIDLSVPRDIASVVEIIKSLKFKNPRSIVNEIVDFDIR
jgi:hypothetical protein